MGCWLTIPTMHKTLNIVEGKVCPIERKLNAIEAKLNAIEAKINEKAIYDNSNQGRG